MSALYHLYRSPNEERPFLSSFRTIWYYNTLWRKRLASCYKFNRTRVFRPSPYMHGFIIIEKYLHGNLDLSHIAPQVIRTYLSKLLYMLQARIARGSITHSRRVKYSRLTSFRKIPFFFLIICITYLQYTSTCTCVRVQMYSSVASLTETFSSQ